MSDATRKLSTVFILSLCMTLTACGGGGGGSDSGGGSDVVDSGDTGGDAGGDTGGETGGDTGGDTGGETGGDTGGDDGGTEEPVDENAPEVTVSSPAMRQLHFSWDAHDGDAYYILSQDPTGDSGYTQIEQVDEGTEATMDVAVHKHDGADTTFIVEACDANDECVPSADVTATDALIDAIGYFKASNTDPTDEFGQAVAISDDGKTMAVGAHDEESGTGEEADNSVRSAGAVYVYTKDESGWVQQAYVKASDIALDDDFGHSVSLSGDGNTLVVGAPWEEDTTAEGDHYDTGAVYVFTREDGVWSEQAYLHAATPRTSAHFGVAVSLSDDGNRLAVGAYGRDAITSEAEDGTITTSPAVPGAVHVLTRSAEGEWSETTELTANNLEGSDIFGYDVALSGDGSTLIVGAHQESSAATGVNGDQADNSAAEAGAAYVFVEGASGWEQQAYLKASAAQAGAHFGYAVAISNTGDLAAVGAQGETENAGAVHLFGRTDGTWAHQAKVTASNTEAGDSFGADLALTEDGSMLAVGATKEDGGTMGVGGDESSDQSVGSGAVYVFTAGDAGWTQSAYVKAPNTQEHALFGHSVALDATGAALAVGAIGEDGKSAGVDGDQTAKYTDEEVIAADGNPVETGAGAVYLY